MSKKIDKTQLKRLIILTVIVLVILIIILITYRITNSKASTRSYAEVNVEVQENKKQANLQKLYDMSEQERMSFYCGQFFKYVDSKNYEEAYNLLYNEYKDNYFPTLASFKKYCEDYFPDDISLSYENIERLGDIYIMWIYVNDTLNGSQYGHNFDMYMVVQENDYNDYVLSFSRDSAVNSMKGDE